jgi:hypothetical protein
MIGGVLEISELHVMISMLDLGYCLYVPASRMLIIWSCRLTLSPCNDNSSLKEAFSEVYYIQAACLVIGGYLDGRLHSDLVLTVIKIYFASYLTTLDAS